MKKQLVSILFALCMVLCLVPLAAFAEGETENMREVTDQTTLFDAVKDTTVTTVKLTSDITISDTLTVKREVTLDLNGFVLKYQNDSQRGSVIKVESGGNLTLTDSDAEKVHKFNKSGMPWTLAADDAAGENIVDVPGGIITGGTGTFETNFDGKDEYNGGGVYVDENSTFTMTSGSIVGCKVNKYGGGVFVEGSDTVPGRFSMSGGLIAGCLADGGQTLNGISGGGIYNEGHTELSVDATIRSCNAINSKYGNNSGGGICNTPGSQNSPGSLTISGNVTVIDCDAVGQHTVMDIVGVCNISGGTFYGAIEFSPHDALGNSSITGGIFYGDISGNFSNYVQEGSATVSVTFATNGGSAVDTQNILRGQKATKPADPTKEGYTFDKWYNGTEAYDFNQPVTKGIDLTAKWMAGTGTAENPYLISTAEELKAFHDIVNGENGRAQKLDACATLTADIVLNDGTFDEDGNYTPGPSSITPPTEWTPMGVTYSAAYTGTFDGAGHTIQGLYCNSNSRAPGLFGYIEGATIQGVRVTGYFNANNAEQAGCIAALAKSSRITGCVSTASINGHHSFQSSTGGIVGIADSSTQVSDCINYGTVKCTPSNYYATFAGGIVGCLADYSTVTNCSNFGTIIGLVNGSSTQPIYVGGIVGTARLESISDCYNAGAVRINEQSSSSATQGAGGIAGYAGNDAQYPIHISNCYNVGSVTAANANAMLGGIVGRSRYDSVGITNCYYLTGTAGQVYGNGTATVTNTTEKSAFDFANGGVLALLMADRPADAQPWDTTCKYLESAGMTLPVLASQKLTVHTHVWSTYTTDTAAKTHTRSCACGVAETEACTITPATCKDVSACAVCGQQYGGPDTGKHADLQHFPAVAATTDAEGNKEYWYCGGCGKYFADAAATREITQADTVTAKLPQPTTPPTATPTASPTAQPTTAPQAAEQPRRTAQPTVQPTAAPTVQPVSTIPATGDTSSPILWAALLLCSGAGLAVTAYKKNKHRS